MEHSRTLHVGRSNPGWSALKGKGPLLWFDTGSPYTQTNPRCSQPRMRAHSVWNWRIRHGPGHVDTHHPRKPPPMIRTLQMVSENTPCDNGTFHRKPSAVRPLSLTVRNTWAVHRNFRSGVRSSSPDAHKMYHAFVTWGGTRWTLVDTTSLFRSKIRR